MSGRNKRSKERVFLGLGGNIGDPARAMGAALRRLGFDRKSRIVAVSSLFRTPPWGKTDQPDFLNACAEITTDYQPSELLAVCLDAERALKRERLERWGPRTIDIDVLVFGDRAIHEAGLDIPHPRMLERAFVLAPLNEIAPELVVAGKTVAQWLDTVDATGVVRQPWGQDWWTWSRTSS